MERQFINLKWKSFHSNIVTGFEDLWEEEGLVDVTLTSDGRCLKAHKVILSASSPLFKEIFMMNPCKHPVIMLQDVHFRELEAILKFVYKGEVNILEESLPSLLQAAETLQIRGLCDQVDSKVAIEEDDVNADVHSNQSESPNLPPVEAVLDSHGSPPLKRPRTTPNQLNERSTKPEAVVTTKDSEDNTCHKTEASLKSIDILHSEEIMRTSSHIPTPSVAAAAVFPVPSDILKSVPRPDSPAISEASGDEPVGGQGSELDPNQDSSRSFAFPPFPCPFCDRAYTRWGFRRRHIKSCHTRTQRLPCKWCSEVLPSHTEWEHHVCVKHSLSRNDARNGLLILEEAEVVLQIPQPTKLDELVTMIKECIDDGQENSVKW